MRNRNERIHRLEGALAKNLRVLQEGGMASARGRAEGIRGEIEQRQRQGRGRIIREEE
jgi:hypothetical protein